MAKNVNLENSKLNVYFDRNLSFDTFALAINKVGINAENARLDNSHIHIEGAEKNGVSPRANEGAVLLDSILLGI
ncbi:hypothetical protein A4A71_09520 [Nicoletella semolina]|nr:hypothetical protein [Nicoletella semolina]